MMAATQAVNPPSQQSFLFSLENSGLLKKKTKSPRVTDRPVTGLWGQERPKGRRHVTENKHQNPGE